jgi:hypothetical protein
MNLHVVMYIVIGTCSVVGQLQLCCVLCIILVCFACLAGHIRRFAFIVLDKEHFSPGTKISLKSCLESHPFLLDCAEIDGSDR